MRAADIGLPRPQMGRLPQNPGKLRRFLRSVSRMMEENQTVRDFLLRHELAAQVPWVLNPPHYRSEEELENGNN